MINKSIYRFAKQSMNWKVTTPGTDKYSGYLQYWQKVDQELKENKIPNKSMIEYLQENNLYDQNLNALEWLQTNQKSQNLINNDFNYIVSSQVKLLNTALYNGYFDKDFYNNYCNGFLDYQYIMRPNHMLSVQVIKLINQMNEKFGLDDNNTKITMIYIQILKDQLEKLNLDYLTLSYFFVSKMNVGLNSVKLYFEIFHKYTQVISEKLEQFTNIQIKSLYYTLGKHGFYDEKIEQHLIQRLQEPLVISNDNDFKNAINFLMCTVNMIFSVENKEIFTQIFNQLSQQVDQYVITQQNHIINYYQTLMRCQFYDEDIWRILLNHIPNMKHTTQMITLLHNMCVFVDEFPESIQSYIKDNIEVFNKQYSQEIEKIHKPAVHYLEQTINDELKNLNIEFINNMTIDGFEVDFYFPSKRLIIEVLGPIHYNFKIQTNSGEPFIINEELVYFQQKLSLVSEFKLRKYKKMGYEVKIINFFDLRKIDLQSLILKMLKQ